MGGIITLYKKFNCNKIKISQIFCKELRYFRKEISEYFISISSIQLSKFSAIANLFYFHSQFIIDLN